MLNNYFFRLTLFLVVITSIYAQNADITGVVRDKKSGEYLIGSNILLYTYTESSTDSALTDLLKGTSTNSYGFYSLTNISKGKYKVVFKNLGYSTVTEVVNVGIESGTIILDIEMEQKSIEIQEILVEASKEIDSEIGKIDISPQLLSKLPTMSGEADVFKTLQFLPGVKNASEISNGLYVRGGTPDHNLTIVDEVPLYNPAHMGNFASTFNSYAIQDIELYKGVYPAEYGGRIGSVLDIKLRSGTREREKGKIGFGFINSHYAFEGPLGEKSTYILSGRFMYLDQIQKQFDASPSTPRYNFSDVNLKTTSELSNGNIVSFSTNYSNDELYSSEKNKDIKYDINWSNFTLSLNWLQNYTKSFFSKTVVSLVKYNFSSILQDKLSDNIFSDYYSSTNITDFNINRSIETTVFDEQKIYAGVGLSFHNYEIIYSKIYFEQLNIGENISNVEGIGYIQHEALLWDRLNINSGIRINYFSDNDFTSFEPRVSLSYRLTGNLSLKVGATKNSQFVHLVTRNDISLPTDIWYPSTNKIIPSRSYQLLFGIDALFNKLEYKVSAEVYYRRMKNLYEFKNVNDFSLGDPIEDLFTKGEAESYGAEFFLNKRIGRLTGWVGYTYSFTKKLFPQLNTGKIFHPRYDRRHDISVVLSYEVLEDFNFGLTWTYASGQGITMPTGQYYFPEVGIDNSPKIQYNYNKRNAYLLPDYHKLDLNFNYNTQIFGSDCNVYLNLFNVYNRQNPFAYYITNSSNEKPILKQVTLFPFIPTIGIVLDF